MSRLTSAVASSRACSDLRVTPILLCLDVGRPVKHVVLLMFENHSFDQMLGCFKQVIRKWWQKPKGRKRRVVQGLAPAGYAPVAPPRANGPPPRGLNGPQAGRFASARLPELVTIPRPMCGAAKEVIPAHVSGLPCPGSAFDPGSGARREAMRIFRHPGWSMVMVGFLGLTAHGQEGAQVQNNSAPAAANAVAATANGQPILEAALQRGLKRLPPEKQAEARTEILEYLIDNVLIDQQLQQLRIEVAAKDVDARMEQIKGEIKKSNQTLEKALTKLGLTEDELRGQLTAEMRWEKYANEQITEKDVKEVFDKNPEIFDGSMVRARHILLTP